MRGRAQAQADTAAAEAVALLERFGEQMLATANRWSLDADDAQDAYQRAAEILMRKRPSGDDDEVRRWLRTTVKHEALAVRRKREPLALLDSPPEPPDTGSDAHERAERIERLRLGAQALTKLKPQEVRALTLRAEGYTYREIAEITNWSATKV